MYLLESSEWIEDACKHVLVNIRMEGSDGQLHRLENTFIIID